MSEGGRHHGIISGAVNSYHILEALQPPELCAGVPWGPQQRGRCTGRA